MFTRKRIFFQTRFDKNINSEHPLTNNNGDKDRHVKDDGGNRDIYIGMKKNTTVLDFLATKELNINTFCHSCVQQNIQLVYDKVNSVHPAVKFVARDQTV